MGYIGKPFVVRQKYYNAKSFRTVAYFEDEASAIEKFEELRQVCLRDWIKVVDLRTGSDIADTRPPARSWMSRR